MIMAATGPRMKETPRTRIRVIPACLASGWRLFLFQLDNVCHNSLKSFVCYGSRSKTYPGTAAAAAVMRSIALPPGRQCSPFCSTITLSCFHSRALKYPALTGKFTAWSCIFHPGDASLSRPKTLHGNGNLILAAVYISSGGS